MSRYILALFAILAIFSIGVMAGQPKCPANSVWSECGSACPPSCDKPHSICTLQCVPSCVCIKGHVRDKCGKCIPECDCPRKN